MVYKIKSKHVAFPLFFFFKHFLQDSYVTIRKTEQTNTKKRTFIKILSYIVFLFFIVYLSLVKFR